MNDYTDCSLAGQVRRVRRYGIGGWVRVGWLGLTSWEMSSDVLGWGRVGKRVEFSCASEGKGEAMKVCREDRRNK